MPIRPMPDHIAIRVGDLGKRYRIGGLQEKNKMFREALVDAALTPVRMAQSVARGESPFRRKNNTFWALRNLSFDVPRGEVVGVIGRNGSGKSTLLKVLTRITVPDEGYAQIRGRVGALLEVGTGFHQELTGRENTYLNGAILGMRREEIDAQFDEIVAFSGVEKFIDTPVKHYSSGMYLRLAFSVAAHLQSNILLIDEVLAVGDAEFQQKCLSKMGQVAGEGRTVLFVSHQMSSILDLCNRVLVLDSGEIIFDGDAEEGVAHYLTHRRRQQLADISLGERLDREGSGEFRFESVVFKDAASGQPLEVLISGQPVRIEIGYTVHEEPLGNIHATISLFSPQGYFMFACNNEVLGAMVPDLGKRGTMVCTIEKWPLMSGVYSYHLFAQLGNQVVDWVRDAGHINVEDGPFYVTGRKPTYEYRGVLIDFDWTTIIDER